jgi:hypothetical protein
MGFKGVVCGSEGAHLVGGSVCTIKSQVMPFMPTKSDACKGKVFTAKPCKGEKRFPDASKLGPTS